MKGWLIGIVVGLVLTLCVAALFTVRSTAITIGSKKFPESRLLGEMMAQLVEANTEHRVERRFGLASNLAFTAIVAGEIDAYVEYTGTGLIVLLKEPLGQDRDPDRIYQRVKEGFAEEFDLRWLEPLGFHNSYAMVVREETDAEAISDLKAHEDTIRAGFNHAFLERPDGYPGLAKHYGLNLADVGGIGHTQAYQAMASREIDLMEAYTTDGRLKKYNLKALEDDKDFFPPYDAAAVVREQLAERRPDVIEEINRLAGRLDQATMVELNYRVEVEEMAIPEVARSFLLGEGLIDESYQPANLSGGMTVWGLWPYVRDHLKLTLIATAAASLVGVFLGLLVARHPKSLSGPILGTTSVIQTIPSLALIALMIPLFGMGADAAIIALFLYSLLPIVRNTYTGVAGVPAHLKEAGRAMGMTTGQLLFQLELPLATKTIMAGVRTALVICVGTATLAGFIRAGGLGELILTGLDMDDQTLVLWGAVPAALLALACDGLMGVLERILEPKGLRISN